MTLFVGLVSPRFVFVPLAVKAPTLCVSRRRSSPLSSLLSGIDDVRMFWDFGVAPISQVGHGCDLQSGDSWLRQRPVFMQGLEHGRDQFDTFVGCLADMVKWPRSVQRRASRRVVSFVVAA